jgi:hypothetical protein
MGLDRYHISIQVPTSVQPKARYALRQLSLVLGLKFELVDRDFSRPDAVYGDATERCPDCLWLPYDPDAYDVRIKHQGHRIEGVKVWGPASATGPSWDLVGATFRLLTFQDESQVSEASRDNKGVFTVDSLPRERQLVLAEMLVENHAAVLSRRLAAQKQMANEFVVPLWPQGKKWVFLLSHDTDAITLGSPQELLTNLLKGLFRGDATSLTMFKDGFGYRNRPNENPLFGFPGWRQLEEPRFRSCFYLFVKPKNLKRHFNDCRSTVVEQKIDWGILREMAAAGWEFGLHAPIYAKREVSALVWGKQFIEEKIGQPVSGLRHHYWALDWRQPHLTFRKHIAAGFQYDASIAWRDSEGFRAGTCFPFQPFDPDRQAAMPIFELPTCLMDGHVVEASTSSFEPPSSRPKAGESGAARAHTLLRQIKARNGVAFLNWHTETACNRYRYKGYVDVLTEVLRPVAADSEAWITTPRELVAWWSKRQQQLATGLQSGMQ